MEATKPAVTRVDSWSELVSVIDRFAQAEENEHDWCFRGQANASWNLTPSLLRCFEGVDMSFEQSWRQALYIETMASDRFFRAAHLRASSEDLPKDNSRHVDWWALMQHHGCPTRLLDWTRSPYVAVYFAVNQLDGSDGAVWAFPSIRLQRAARKRLPTLELDWEDHYDEDRIHAIHTYEPHHPPLRTVVQQGVFTVCTHILDDHDEIINSYLKPPDDLCRIDIPASLKAECLSRLRTMNISGGTLFPDLGGLGRSVGELIQLVVARRREKGRLAAYPRGGSLG